MNAMWLAVSCLVDRARRRARTALDGNPESGALSLEWILIAVAVVGAAALAGTLITAAIHSAAGGLP
jgi:hypothetical protein